MVCDWHLLRTKHRICGTLIGSITSYPRQNDFLGLPMALMSEEAALLVDIGTCKLYAIENIVYKPSDKQKEDFKTHLNRALEEQRQVLRKKKIEQLSQKIDVIIAGKRQKLLSKGITDVYLDKQTLLQEEINKLPILPPVHLLEHLPTEFNLDAETNEICSDILLPSIKDPLGSLKCAVYRDLWQRGHYITDGAKFGSDYLVYPGDPVRFHAMYMVRCISDRAKSFQPAYLVSYGRMSVAVNKLAVLAFRNNYGRIEYQTLQWHDSIS
ncbi:tRNA-splicing endonuclease subunit Sen34 isoform X2 [Plodia interpunctella]|uniref:tRNA-splicing endonuclease subunit Sen34 isoform X2 n=1 Tax=Plodia interpunctella TaxID=58824 RepID=UPI00236814B3|nr:tRNA-splicing endonuclease subunit Sen34 isoform X2 [Plodia interpunctella]